MSTPGPELTDVVSPWVRRAWAAAYVLLGLALVWVLLSWAGVLVVVGSTVVPVWVAGPALLLVWAVVRLGLGACRVPTPSLGARWLNASSALTVGVWVLVPLTAAVDAFGAPSYAVLEPDGSGGCRAVVAESSFLMSGSGTVHVAGGWGPFAPEVGGYITDDGFRPVATGSYDVSWDDRYGGLLSIAGTLPGGGSGADDGPFVFDC